MKNYRIVSAMLAVLLAVPSIAQDDLTGRLVDLGFMNVRTAGKGSTVYVAFEDSGYRGEYRAAAAAIQAVQDAFPDAEKVEIAMLQNQVAKVALHASKTAGTWSVSGDFGMYDVLKELEGVRPERSSSGVVEVNVHPQFSYDNHLLEKFCEYGVYLAPSIEATLWKGGRVTIQPILPLFNNLDQYDINRKVQLGVCTIQQDFSSRNGRWYGMAAAGSFLFNHLGVLGQAGYHITKGLDVDLTVGVMSKGYFYWGGWWASWMNKISAQARVSYYWAQPKIELQLSGGRFLYGDYGARLDATRHFGEVAVGMYLIHSGGESSGGIHFAIPLGPARQVRKGNFALRLPHYFDWKYNIVSTGSQYEFGQGNYGYEVEHRPDQNHSAHYWQPEFIAEYTAKMLNGNIL